MSHDDHDHNPRMQPTNKEAHHAIVWLSSGLIVVGVIGLLAGQIVGVTGVITGALHRMCRRGLAGQGASTANR